MLSFLRRLPGMGRLLRTLGISGVPVSGYFGAGWPLGTLLLLYWLETILITLVVAALILLHRRSTRKAGHWNHDYTITFEWQGKETTRTGKTTFLAYFLGIMVPFTAVHGVFVLLLALFVFPEHLGAEAGVSLDALTVGMGAITLCLVASLLFDLKGLGKRPFRWVEGLAGRAKGRMLVTHLTIIFGAGAMLAFEAPLAFFSVFVGLKALVDLGGLMPEPEPKPKPEAPRVVKSLGRLIPEKDGKGLAELYLEGIEVELRKQEANEQVLAPHELPS